MGVPTEIRCSACGQTSTTPGRFCGFCGARLDRDPDVTAPDAAQPRGDRILTALRAATIGEYDIAGEIGRGGMAVVYLAHDLSLNRKVAIKVLLPELLYSEGMDRRFKHEARTAAKLDHPNILVVHGVREANDLLYIVTKLVEGLPLSAIIAAASPLPIPVVRYVVRCVADALAYAHAEGVVHRDVKPANIMVDRRGNIVVMDFGIAKAADDVRLTRTGFLIGTPAYMSPEQYVGQAVTPASDQYSLGILAYELLTGQTPFRGSPVEMQWSHAMTEPAPVRALRPDCPAELDASVLRMLAKSPAARWPSLQEVARSLDDDPATVSAARAALVAVVTEAPGQHDALPATPASPVPFAAVPPAGSGELASETPTRVEPAPSAEPVPNASAEPAGSHESPVGRSVPPAASREVTATPGRPDSARPGRRWPMGAAAALGALAIVVALYRGLARDDTAPDSRPPGGVTPSAPVPAPTPSDVPATPTRSASDRDAAPAANAATSATGASSEAANTGAARPNDTDVTRTVAPAPAAPPTSTRTPAKRQTTAAPPATGRSAPPVVPLARPDTSRLATVRTDTTAYGASRSASPTTSAGAPPGSTTATPPPAPARDSAAERIPAPTRDVASALFKEFATAINERAYSRITAAYSQPSDATAVSLWQDFLIYVRDYTPRATFRSATVDASQNPPLITATIDFRWSGDAGYERVRPATFVGVGLPVAGRWQLHRAHLTKRFW